MRALTKASLDFSDDINRQRPNIVQFCDSQSLVKSIEGRLMDCKRSRNSATRVWWPQISSMLRWWRNGGAKWVVNWRRGHIERRVPEGKNWAPADWGNVIADVVAGRGWKVGDEEEAYLGMEDLGEGKEWEGWDEVLLAWAGVGSVAASMRMVWADRNSVWRKVEVALVEQQTGEAREGIAGGRGAWRLRAQALVEAVEEWLASNAAATDQAIRDMEGGVEPSVPLQNSVELVTLVSATRTSAVLAAEAESRCARELATLKALRGKLLDTEMCKMCPAGNAPVLQTRWHILGECGHRDLRDARVKSAKELQEKARVIFTRKIKDKAGRLPHWWMLFAITADDKWIWPPSEQGVNDRSGWQESHWWGLWGPKRLDEWASAYEEEFKFPVSASTRPPGLFIVFHRL